MLLRFMGASRISGRGALSRAMYHDTSMVHNEFGTSELRRRLGEFRPVAILRARFQMSLASMEIQQIRNEITTLRARFDALRGYL